MDNSIANRNFPCKFDYGFHFMPVQIDAQVSVGSTGAPTITNGLGIKSITRLSAGTYQIQLQDNYPAFTFGDVQFISPASGTTVTGGSFVTGTVYQIVTLGSTTQAQWVAAGVPAGITAAPGVVFKATAAGAGSGTAAAPSSSGIGSAEFIGLPSTMLNNEPFNAGSGAYLSFHCLAPTSSSVTTPVATDPASGTIMLIKLFMNNSSVQ